jgi:cobalt/nickel transport system permease protein
VHIITSYLSGPVAAGCGALAAGALAAALVRSRKTLDDQMVPLVGVMGAFVFAAQMVNFQIAPGTSGHLVGGFLLGVLCGWAPAMVTMAAILIIQALVFADGGVDALGANILNMGVLPCLLGGLVRRLWQSKGLNWTLPLAGVGAWLAVLLGAGLVMVEFWLSGKLASRELILAMGLPMLGFHTLSGVIEGLVTALVLGYVSRSHIVEAFARKEAAS